MSVDEQAGGEVTASAPAKVILFGEHAINRGAPALAAAVGIHARCTVGIQGGESGVMFKSGSRVERAGGEAIRLLTRDINDARDIESFETIRRIARTDYFAPQKYILGSALGERLPEGLRVEWTSDVPSCSGLGSGGSAFVSMVAAVSSLLKMDERIEERARWAHLGDIVAHGGVASGLDTQTSLLGGVIRYTGNGLAEGLAVAPGLSIVIGNTGIAAATAEVNTAVRHWLNERPEARIHCFQSIGALSRAAIRVLERGDWEELGRLMTLNQLVLEKIGVSRPEIDRLIDAALEAGALGAKVSGSGGGGIIIALTSVERRAEVADAIRRAGGEALTPEVAVGGVRIEDEGLEGKA